MDNSYVLSALREHLAIMNRGADHTALKLAIREIERLQPYKHPLPIINYTREELEAGDRLRDAMFCKKDCTLPEGHMGDCQTQNTEKKDV